MANQISLSQDRIIELREKFEKLIASPIHNGIFKMEETLRDDRKASVIITPMAYAKMIALVQNYTTEVGWHGRAKRGEVDGEYIIYDIIIYPQDVTGASVTTDQKEYSDWNDALDIDTLKSVRFHGHSHVNFSASPSSVDREHYEGLTSMLGRNDFYVFMIINKSGNIWCEIQDNAINAIYKNNDITVDVRECDDSVNEFLVSAQKNVKERVVKSVIGYANQNVSKHQKRVTAKQQYNMQDIYDDDEYDDTSGYVGYYGGKYCGY